MTTAISYTFPSSCPVAALRGMLLEGGVPSRQVVGGKTVATVSFATLVQGKTVHARIDDKPALKAAHESYIAAQAAELAATERAKGTALEVAVPGAAELVALHYAVEADFDRHQRGFDRMMADENNDGARPPQPFDQAAADKLDAMLAANPRAALYLLAIRQRDGAHWADNSGAGLAASKAIAALMAGAPLEAAQAALSARREWVD